MVVWSGRLLLGIVLIMVGGLFLLRTLGIIQVEVWGLVVPVFLIVLGAWGIWSASRARPAVVSEHLRIPAEGASRAAVSIRYGAGRLRISGGTAEGEVLRLELRRPPDAWLAIGIPWVWS